jgi:hypothetical protein
MNTGGRNHTVREILGSRMWSKDLDYFIHQVSSLDTPLTEKQENILDSSLGKLLSGEMGMDGQCALARILENRPPPKNEEWEWK